MGEEVPRSQHGGGGRKPADVWMLHATYSQHGLLTPAAVLPVEEQKPPCRYGISRRRRRHGKRLDTIGRVPIRADRASPRLLPRRDADVVGPEGSRFRSRGGARGGDDRGRAGLVAAAGALPDTASGPGAACGT